MNLGYLDDVSFGGPADVVAADVAQIAKVGGDMGLHLNASKCELIAHPNFSTTDALLQFLHELMSVMPPFWVHLCFTALSWTNRGMVAQR